MSGMVLCTIPLILFVFLKTLLRLFFTIIPKSVVTLLGIIVKNEYG
jgi:hypothetical protein